MQIKIIAVGSTKQELFLRKWGISYLIGDDLLFDTFGDPYVFLRNAEKMNIDFAKIKHIIISHDHWDHISGLWHIINKYKELKVYICPNFDIKIKEKIASLGVRVVEVGGFLSVKEGIYTTGELEGEFRNTSIAEQAVVLNSKDGLIVVTGCAHPGILKILEEVKKKFPDQTIFSVLGGFHLLDKERQDIEPIVNKFKEIGIKKVGPAHCSGELAEEIFRQQYKYDFIQLKAKETIQL